MKLFKKIAFGILTVLILMLAGGYIYFDRKFTPEKNYLTVKNESGNIPINWLGKEKNVLLLPIHFSGNPETYYLQFDTGSPYTVFYSNSIKNINEIKTNNDRAKTSFFVGKTQISSSNFKIFNIEKDGQSDSLKIIGTIGADILEDRKTVINFKESYVTLNLKNVPKNFKNNLVDFKFKKRKIIIPGVLKGEERKFLYDSGTSAYEFLTYKEEWQNLKSKSSKVKIEKSRSWNNILTTYTANCHQNIRFKNQEIPVEEITYVEGFSNAQFSLMKFSGMTGMLGNKIFLKNSIFIDCKDFKIGID
ncbi:hypothetical protein LUD75_07955 [Epilithonimonas sp. JDS]|uniref:hypothetical protein n=1 Tax=Epilithonimonas sp. JDS TaxID=2902797 RepID=UPI001E348391|nr:hypothetical protein [Epilithonimonas sp. JDS]MCD9854637.1 hypothetical protein [Epilithonimonas sp. JDS]